MQRLCELQEPYEQHIELLQMIPGIKEVAARLIFAELFDNHKDFFRDSEHFCPWLGICLEMVEANLNGVCSSHWSESVCISGAIQCF